MRDHTSGTAAGHLAHPAGSRGWHPADGHQTHGNTVAAWVGVAVILIGTCIAAAALPADAPWLFWVGIGVAVFGAVAGKVMSLLGFGPAAGYHQEGDAEMRDELFGSAEHPEGR
ncbi:MAG: hypothetical protein HOV68_07225 [Streptomycetaceae bacterium]|nr:hypothetical protein [Streptomycetaceae bacterium]